MRVDGIPGEIYFRWSGGNLQIVNSATNSVLLEIASDEVKLTLSEKQVKPTNTSENWLPAGPTLMEDEKYSVMSYATEQVAIAGPNDDSVIGVAYNEKQIEADELVPIYAGIVNVLADDGTITEGTDIKAGFYGRVQTWRDSAAVINAAVGGEADEFANQPADNLVQVEQASNEATDRGLPVTIIGTEPGTGDLITETINLHSTDTTTAVVGAVAFDDVLGAYFGTEDAAANIEIQRENDNAVICTIPTGSNDVGAPTLADPYAYCSLVYVEASAQSADYLTLYGTGPDYNPQMERLQLDNADPGKVTSTVRFRTVDRLITGELDENRDHDVEAVADGAGDKIGKTLEDASSDGDIIKAYIKPNLV